MKHLKIFEAEKYKFISNKVYVNAINSSVSVALTNAEENTLMMLLNKKYFLSLSYDYKTSVNDNTITLGLLKVDEISFWLSTKNIKNILNGLIIVSKLDNNTFFILDNIDNVIVRCETFDELIEYLKTIF